MFRLDQKLVAVLVALALLVRAPGFRVLGAIPRLGRLMRWLLITVTLLALLAACGGDESSPDESGDTVGTQVAEAVQETMQAHSTDTVQPTDTPITEPTAVPTSVPSPTPELSCSTDDGDLVFTLLTEFSREWDDVMAVAESTGRIALSGPVQELQSIRRNVQDQDWPECASTAQTELILMMEARIEGLLAFMGQAPDADINEHIQAADEHDARFRQELIYIAVNPDSTELADYFPDRDSLTDPLLGSGYLIDYEVVSPDIDGWEYGEARTYQMTGLRGYWLSEMKATCATFSSNEQAEAWRDFRVDTLTDRSTFPSTKKVEVDIDGVDASGVFLKLGTTDDDGHSFVLLFDGNVACQYQGVSPTALPLVDELAEIIARLGD